MAASSAGTAPTASNTTVPPAANTASAAPTPLIFRNVGFQVSRAAQRTDLVSVNTAGPTPVSDDLDGSGVEQRLEDRRAAVKDRDAVVEATAARVAKTTAVRAAKAAAKVAAKVAAAKAAATEQAAAVQAAAQAKTVSDAARSRAATQAGATSGGNLPTTALKAWAAAELATMGYGPEQFTCLDQLWTRESGWNPLADNPTSDAYGIPQSLPGNKMAAAGPDWLTNPKTQIAWGLGYIKSRYATPCQAWAHSEKDNWY